MRQLQLVLLCTLAGACGYDAGSPAEPDASMTAVPSPHGDAGSRDAAIPTDGAASGDAGTPASDAGPPSDGSGLPACSNGIDDDCDGLVDHAGGDPGCVSPDDDDEHGPGLICDDGIDNDGDQLVDYRTPECGGGDPECSSPSDTSERETPGPI